MNAATSYKGELMNTFTIYESSRYQVQSHGQGAAVTLTNKQAGMDCWLQGADASNFLDEAFIFDSTEMTEWYLSQYDDIMQPAN